MIKLAAGIALFLAAGTAVAAQQKVDCGTRGNAVIGVPGTAKVVECPAGCTEGPLWGSIIYSDDSAICSAAIHAGYLKVAGGKVGVYIRGSQPRFLGSVRNGIQSSEYGAWTRSFSLTHPRDLPQTTSRGSAVWLGALRNWAIVLVLVTGLVLVFRWRKGQVKKLTVVFQDLAQRLGLEFEPSTKGQAGTARGNLDGYEVSVCTYTTTSGSGSGRTSSTYVQAETLLARPILKGVRVFPRGAFTKLTTAIDRLAGEHEIATGNAEFDEVFYVAAQDESSRSLFNPEVQKALLEYAQARTDWDLFLGGNTIKATRGIRVVTRGDLERLLRLQGDVAEALSRY